MDDENASMIQASPPPRKSDILFGAGTDWQANACVNGIDDPIAYQDGYRRAALYLAEHVSDVGGEKDLLGRG